MRHAPPHRLSGAAFAGQRIGLLGGSFNPAHAGHLHISRIALQRLGLRQVWWLVSPQNPLKQADGMASLAARLASARAVSAHCPAITVTALEQELGTRFTADTLHALRRRFPRTRFIWLMGADNLLQIPRWQRWQRIFRSVPIAVFRRPPYAVGAAQGKAALRFGRQRLDAERAALLGTGTPPRWVLFSNRLNPISATQLRAQNSGRYQDAT